MERFESLHTAFPTQAGRILTEIDALISDARAAGEISIRAKSLLLKGNCLYIAGKMPEAIAICDRHEGEVREAGLTEVVSGFLNLRAINCSNHSDYLGAIRFQREALESLKGSEDVATRAYLLCNLGLDLDYLGDFAMALSVLEESVALWRSIEEDRRIIPSLINLGVACEHVGEIDLAIQYMREAISASRKVGDRRRLCMALVNLAGYEENRGESETGLVHAREGLEIAREMGIPPIIAHALVAVVEGHCARDDWASARAALEEALSLYETVELPRGVASTLIDLAKLPDAAVEDRRRFLLRSIEIAQESGMKPEESKARLQLAEIESSVGAHAEAYEHLRRARELERQSYDEETQRRLQAVRIRSDLESLTAELREERRAREEIARLLEEVRTQRLAAEEASRQKSALLGIAAHDMRSGLSGVMGGLELAHLEVEHGGSLATLREYLELTQKAGQELLGLFQRLLDHAAIERGEISSEPQVFSLVEGFERIFKHWAGTAAEKHQRLVARGGAHLSLWVDPARWRQIVSNLVNNALKYSPEHSEIEFEARISPENAGMVRFEVRDRGPGLTAADEALLFRPFQKLSAQPTGGESSTGLGLHIVSRLVVNEGGQVGYFRREGGGSTFWVELPRAATDGSEGPWDATGK